MIRIVDEIEPLAVDDQERRRRVAVEEAAVRVGEPREVVRRRREVLAMIKRRSLAAGLAVCACANDSAPSDRAKPSAAKQNFERAQRKTGSTGPSQMRGKHTRMM